MDELNIREILSIAVKKHNEGELDEAEILYRKILGKEPDNPDALNLLGAIDYQSGKYRDAVEKINRAVQINPDNAIYHYNLAMSYDALGEEEKSAENFIRVLEINPEYSNAHIAHYNLGIYFENKGEIDKALEHYNKAIELDKNFFDAYWNRGLDLLLSGRFNEGWEDYEYRFKKKSPTDKRNFDKPKWGGDFLNGKKILIASEQGFGDNIQFIRYTSLVKEKGGYVIFECRKELRKLFENFPGIDEFVDKGGGFLTTDYDFYIHLMSLPGVFNTNLQSIPSKIPYLKADHLLAEKFKSKINSDKFKIGVVWSGNPDFPGNKKKSVDLEKFKSLSKIPEVELFSLQKGKTSGQLEDWDEIINLADEINDFADTAAVIENMDLIISVDTAVVHLAGAMGKPVWVLLSFVPDWRWLLERRDSPWYPGMKLFRQKKRGNWDDVFEEVEEELRRVLDKNKIGS